MKHSAIFREALERCDVAMVRKLWIEISPHLPQPKTDGQALVIIHRARTESRSIAFKLRAYSHRWLLDNGYPSGLPDELKPRAERVYPKIVSGVGIAVGSTSVIGKAIAPMIQRAMENAVLEAYAEGRQNDSEFVKARMMEAKASTVRKLVGRLA